MKVSPYCELYANQLLKDVEYVALHGFDALIMQRSKANLACDTVMNKQSRTLIDAKRNVDVSPGQDQPPLSSLRVKSPPKSIPKSADENGRESSTKLPKFTKSPGNLEWKPADDWTRIEVDTGGPTISSATQLLGEALRTTPSEVRCTICKTTTPSEYSKNNSQSYFSCTSPIRVSSFFKSFASVFSIFLYLASG
ncbi:hypothetical protein COOONC_03562 [Cooperia oncophora]